MESCKQWKVANKKLTAALLNNESKKKLKKS